MPLPRTSGSLKRVNERPCIRCHSPVLLEEGHLVYCSHCGAPQIFLSEELQAEIAQETENYHQRLAPAAPGADAASNTAWRRSGLRQSWPRAVRYALVSAAAALLLGLLSLLLPAVGVLSLFWAVAAPILTVGFFFARSTTGPPATTGFAARLGLLTGLLVALAAATVSALSLVLARFVQHSTAAFDAQIAALFAQQRTLLLQRMGSAAQPTLDLLAIPEFRVGLLLCMVAFSALLYLLMSTLAATLTGLVLSRRRPA